jgi:hypothetical protein
VIYLPTLYDSLTQFVLSVITERYSNADSGQESSFCSWKTIIQLNLIRHVLTILDFLRQEETTACPPSSIDVPILPDGVLEPSHGVSVRDAAQLSGPNPIASTFGNSSSSQTVFRRTLRLRLAPLAEIESMFAKQSTQSPLAPDTSEEPTIYSHSARTKHFGYMSTSHNVSTDGMRFEEGVAQVVDLSKEDIATLWNDKVLRGLLQERNVRFEPEGESFLNDLGRVCALDYEPSDGKFKSLCIPSHFLSFCKY